MKADSAAQAASSVSRSFFICCALSFLFPIIACLGPHPTPYLLILLRAPDFLFLLLWIAAALGLGAAILKLTISASAGRPMVLRKGRSVAKDSAHHALPAEAKSSSSAQPMDWPLRIVVSIALGLGTMSLLVLLIGLFLPLHALGAWCILAAGWLACAWGREVWLPAPVKNQEPSHYRWLLLLCCAALGLAVVGALVPPGVLWGDEPNGYDVLEYHLQVPREWYELGRIVPLRHNVFSYFPFNVEMHYLLAMGLRGGPWAGMYLAQLMHVVFIALTVAAVYALVAERSKPMAFIAAALVATVPWMGLLAPIAYDEGGLLLWGTLSIGLALRGAEDFRTMALAGAMAGLACGAKLTAVPIVLLAMPCIHVAVLRFKPRALAAVALFFAMGVIVFSPWLVRNIAWIGNPVFPEETAVFGRVHWSATQVERWTRANHLPRPDQQNIAGRVAAGWDQVLADWRYGYVLLPLAIVSAALSWKQRNTIVLLLILIALWSFWLFFTHLQSRFFTLAVPISALLIGELRMGRWTAVVYSIVALLAGLGGLLAVDVKVSSISPHLFDFIGVENLASLTPLADQTIPADARVVLVGDAKAFLYAVPTDRLFYRTVFDVDAQPGQTSDEAWQKGLSPWSGQTIQVIDAPELRRFARTYWGIPQPSAEVMQMQEPTVRSP